MKILATPALIAGIGLSALLHAGPALADCPLPFAPAQIADKARAHYYASPKRDSIPPGNPRALPPASSTRDTTDQAAKETSAARNRRKPSATSSSPMFNAGTKRSTSGPA